MKIVYVLPNKIFDKNTYENSLKHILFHFNKKNEIIPFVPFIENIDPFHKEIVYEKDNILVETNQIIEDNLYYLTVKKIDSDFDFENADSLKFFSEVVSKYINEKIKPDVVHVFGSEFGYLVKLLDNKIKTIFNINKITQSSKLIQSLNSIGESESYSPLLYGAIYSDAVIFPSKKLILQIQKGEIKSDLQSVILKRYKNVFGIIHGIDYKIWNPKHDQYLKHNFSSNEIFNKNLCKSKMQKFLDLEINNSIPLIIFGKDINPESGFDIIKSQLKFMSKMKIQFVIFGKPAEKYLSCLLNLKDKYNNIRFVNNPNETFLHKILSSSDIYISPATINTNNYFHLKAMRYGVVPLTYNTGIYADTIISNLNNSKKANGFLYLNKDSASFISKLKEVVEVFSEKELWNSYVKNAMEKDFSWKDILKEYEDLYVREI